VRLFGHQLRNEQRLFWRSHELAFFTFLFPIILFVLLATVYGKKPIPKEHHVKPVGYLLSGVIGYGLASTAFAGLAIILVLRRENGILKRLRATPLPIPTYLAAVLISAAIAYAIEAVVLIVLGEVLYEPKIDAHWLSVVLALLLGTLCFAALGVGLTGYIRSGDGASAVVNAVYLPTSFLAGSFWTTTQYPHWLRAVADALPLTHFIRLMRDTLLLHTAIWSDWRQVAVVGAWGLGGLVFAARGFRWEPREP
jgi:ABC-2 type transport system permease protein